MSFWPQVLTTPSYQLWVLPLLGIALLECLVAIWAVTSKRNWFMRAAGVWVTIALLLPIAAWEPAWVFLLSSLLIVLTLDLVRRLTPRSTTAASSDGGFNSCQSFRFGIRDLFLLVLLVGMWIPVLTEIVRHYHPTKIAGWLVSSVSLAAIAVLCRLTVAGPRRLGAAALLVCAMPAAAAATWYAGDWMNIWSYARLDILTHAQGIVSLTILGSEFALFAIAILAMCRARRPQQQPMAWRIAQRICLGLTLLVPAVPTAAMYGALLKRVPRAAKYVTPAVNQYSRIVAIAEELRRLNPGELSIAGLRATAPSSTTPQQVEALYTELLPLLEASNAAGYDPDRDAIAGYAPPIQLLRSLARALKAEGEAMRLAGRMDNAADYAEANIRVGTMLRRGGTVFEGIVGVALEGVGHHQLAQLRSDLSPDRTRRALASVRRSLAEHEAFASIYSRELDYVQRALGWQGRMEDVGAWFLENERHWSTYFQQVCARVDATNVQLQTDLALRLFEHEHGGLPNELEELVPEYLPEVPLDMHSQQPLKYRIENGGFVLYSVGFDGEDDGGRFGGNIDYGNAWHRNEPGWDFDLDTLTRP